MFCNSNHGDIDLIKLTTWLMDKWFCIPGFALGSTIQSKTKGVWIWAMEHPTDSDSYLVLLDTEGLGDAEKVDSHFKWLQKFSIFFSRGILPAYVFCFFSRKQFLLSRHRTGRSAPYKNSHSVQFLFHVSFPGKRESWQLDIFADHVTLQRSHLQLHWCHRRGVSGQTKVCFRKIFFFIVAQFLSTEFLWFTPEHLRPYIIGQEKGKILKRWCSPQPPHSVSPKGIPTLFFPFKNSSFVTEISKHIKKKTGDDSEEDVDFDLLSPLFVFALRDFCLDLEIDGEEVTADEYMEHCLNLKTDTNEETKRYNRPRLCVRTYFKKRRCFVFDRPVSKHKMKYLDLCVDSGLNSEFKDAVREFVAYMHKEAPVKRLSTSDAVNGLSKYSVGAWDQASTIFLVFEFSKTQNQEFWFSKMSSIVQFRFHNNSHCSVRDFASINSVFPCCSILLSYKNVLGRHQRWKRPRHRRGHQVSVSDRESQSCWSCCESAQQTPPRETGTGTSCRRWQSPVGSASGMSPRGIEIFPGKSHPW